MTDLASKVRDAVKASPGDSPDVVAAALLDRVTKRDLLPLLVRCVEHEQRDQARRAERDAFDEVLRRQPSSPGRSFVPLVKPQETAGAWSQFFGATFAVGSGERVDWATASVDQHRQRIEFLRRMRSGIDESIRRHQAAVEAIEAAGVTCLAELSTVVEDAA